MWRSGSASISLISMLDRASAHSAHRQLARREVEHELLEPLGLLARGEAQRLLEQLLARVEPVGGGRQGHARLGGHGAVSHAVRAVRRDDRERGAQDRLAPRLSSGCLLVHLCHL